jgi:hypothetical protein
LYRNPEYNGSVVHIIGLDDYGEVYDISTIYVDNDIINLSVSYWELHYLMSPGGTINILGDGEFIPVAYLDDCPSDYYVIWQDRTGAYQCQPFSKKSTYRENIDTSYLTNELGEERPYRKSIQSEWTLNSDWLTEEGYKAHESLLTSPKIHLFDTKNDMMWEVNCTNSQWEDKTK